MRSKTDFSSGLLGKNSANRYYLADEVLSPDRRKKQMEQVEMQEQDIISTALLILLNPEFFLDPGLGGCPAPVIINYSMFRAEVIAARRCLLVLPV